MIDYNQVYNILQKDVCTIYISKGDIGKFCVQIIESPDQSNVYFINVLKIIYKKEYMVIDFEKHSDINIDKTLLQPYIEYLNNDEEIVDILVDYGLRIYI